MSPRALLGAALVAAAAIAACDDGSSDMLGGEPRRNRGGGDGTSVTGESAGGLQTTDPNPAPDTEGKKFFVEKIFPALGSSCGPCHEAKGPGPAWIARSDAEGSYKMMFQLGYVANDSRIILKGPHEGHAGTTAEQNALFSEWVAIELAGGKALPNLLEKLGGCLDRELFDAIELGRLRTTPRNNNNNDNDVRPWNEDTNECTGCNNSPCRTCHSGDDATLFVNSIGNPNLPEDFTFEETKKSNPAYIQKYFGVSASGEPIASNALRLKAEATQKDKAYTHPLYRVDDELQQRIDAFVKDAVDKYKAGACGK